MSTALVHMHMKEQHVIAIVDIARNLFVSFSVQVQTFKTNPGIKDGQHQCPESDLRICVKNKLLFFREMSL